MFLTGTDFGARNHFTYIDFLTRDGGGTIDAQEIHEMVMGLFAMSGMEVTNLTKMMRLTAMTMLMIIR